jgi:hypothetical protein
MQVKPISAQEADFFYEQAITACVAVQYKSLEKSHQITKYVTKLNLVYLSLLKNNSFETETVITESKSIVPRPEIPKVRLALSQDSNSKPTSINYAQRHYKRAVQYAQQAEWALAVKELRDAIKL